MTNKDLAKTVIATGAGVVICTIGAPLLVTAPICVALGSYLGWMLNKDHRKKKDDDRGSEP